MLSLGKQSRVLKATNLPLSKASRYYAFTDTGTSVSRETKTEKQQPVNPTNTTYFDYGILSSIQEILHNNWGILLRPHDINIFN